MKKSTLNLMVLIVLLLCACPRAYSRESVKVDNAVDKPGAEAHYKKAADLLLKGQNGAAVAEYIEAIESDPTVAAYYDGLGDAYRGLGKNEMAIIVLERAVTLDPGMTDALDTLGVIYESKGDFNGAIDMFKKAIEVAGVENPALGFYYNDLGAAYIMNKDNKAACEALRKAGELLPDNTAIKQNLKNVSGYCGG